MPTQPKRPRPSSRPRASGRRGKPPPAQPPQAIARRRSLERPAHPRQTQEVPAPESDPRQLEARLALAIDLALRADEILRQGYGHAIQANHKGVNDLVTEYDLRLDRMITGAVHQAFPEDAILSEESGRSGDGRLCWMIDPLDGTTNFAHGLPFFSVSLACVREHVPLAGVIYDPMRDELFSASIGKGSWLNGEQLHASRGQSLEECLLVTGFPYDLRTVAENNLDHFAAFSLRVLAVRRLGSAALDLAYTAAGRLDGYWETGLSPWDFAAGVLLVAEAGGKITRFDGDPDVFAEPTSLVASNGLIHEAMLGVLQGGR
jgi:myo-inositol-1(or 4)-monophosphatase